MGFKVKNWLILADSDISLWLAYCFSLLIFARTKYEYRNKCIKAISICLTVLMLGLYLGHYGTCASRPSQLPFIALICAITFAAFATFIGFITLSLISMKTNNNDGF